MDRYTFELNGQTIEVAGQDTHLTLLNFLRDRGLTGTKEGCAEGDCGACTVAMLDEDGAGQPTWRALNACITLLPMVAGRRLVTVEGLGGCHPVQQRMVENYGSQCGFCTPGFVMSMFEAAYRKDAGPRYRLADQLCGNLCRCTGYRPIRQAMVQTMEAPPADAFKATLEQAVPALETMEYRHGDRTFLRPTTLPALVELKARHPEAWLVAGATEVGVYLNKRFWTFPVLISTEGVADLRRIESNDKEWIVGGAASLTAMEEALHGDHAALDKMLWVFASRQIRNRATLAGNLVTASPIGDMAPVLLALDATLDLHSVRGRRTVALADFFTAYRKTVLATDEIVEHIRIPRSRPSLKVESYKVSKRRELDISIVAAAFALETDKDNVVRHVRLAYGGVAATPARARRTEDALLGNPWTEESVAAAAHVLAAEFTPIDDVRSGVAYRRDLIVSLLWKFFRGDRSEAQDLPIGFEDDSFTGLRGRTGADLPHDSAWGHVSGTALYVDDSARGKGMLTLWPVCSPHAHARIVSRDASEARQQPGVVAVLMAEDVPGLNDVGALKHDEELLAKAEAMFAGHMVAVVVGESVEACRVAAEKVKVTYEPLPALLTIDDAIQADSFHTAPHHIRRGDTAAAMASSAWRIQGDLHVGGQEHFYLESHAAWAECGDEGDVRVYSSTQHPTEIQASVSHVLHLPRNRVVVQSPRMGGGFGGKETQGNTWAALVALAAWKTKRPVRVMLDRDVDLMLTGKRHPFYCRYEVGFEPDGRLQALKLELWSNGGWSLDLSESICDRALFHLDNSYYLPNVDTVGRVCKTHIVSNTAFRGFGGPQGMLMIEDIMDRIARHLGLPAEVVRERNLYRGEGESNTTHYGQLLEDHRLPAIWTELMDKSLFAERRRDIAAWNAGHRMIKRGIAITPVKFGISFTASFLNQAGALVLIYRDGTAQVNHGGTEMGQGLYAKVQGVAMRELGLKAEAVRVMKTSTDKVPNTSPTAASSGSDLNGAAVAAACRTLRERLEPVACRLLKCQAVRFADGLVFDTQDADRHVRFDELAEAAWLAQVSLSATGYYRTPNLSYDRTKGHGRPFHYFAYGAAVTEVEVDGYTGMKRVRQVDIVQDVGDSLNAGVDRGQIEGAYVQGLGWLTAEELKWDKSGKLTTHSASTYQIPAISDAPARFNVWFMQDAAQSSTIHGSKAVGEPPLMLAISAREAIRDAVAAFGTGGDVPLAIPATHEAIHAAVQAQRHAAAAVTVP
ncbi:MAG TPA: xanthine dehydrogenase molybdopterin binding subunit [Candidatus Xenobia bacterium]|jgi:xanthine dehydrogenase molybdopterin binding subunit/xanthine dehydrogenase small subunit